MIALVTGANGFIGSHLCEVLTGRGWEVRALVRRTSDLRWLKDTPVRVCYGDVTQPESLPEPASGVDYIFHIAGVVKVRETSQFDAVNREGTRNLLAATAKNAGGLRKFVFFSTLAAAGPTGEGCGPVSKYGESKLAAEQIVHEYRSKLPVTILRLPAVYGPRDDKFLPLLRVIDNGITQIVKMSLSTCYVIDAVEAAVALAVSPTAGSEPCTVCDGRTYSFHEWARTVEAMLGKKTLKVRIPVRVLRWFAWWNEKLSAEVSIINQDKAREFACSAWTCTNDDLHARTGFVPRFDLQAGMRATIDWYRREGWLR